MEPNCLDEGLERWHKNGGYLMFRKSSCRETPHVMHLSPDGIQHYSPGAPLSHDWSALFGYDGHYWDRETADAPPVSLKGIFIGVLILFIGTTVWCLKKYLSKLIHFE